jgi:hypothetical protein
MALFDTQTMAETPQFSRELWLSGEAGQRSAQIG